ncbi:C-C motif chemokine 27-like isoform X2 [Mus musculus]|uniref:C-C motif chemokine 27-like isoform X2 n=1 Tax=Mus musculus TaxID=10090 RepID=UPI0011AE9179|nr:C-C motif chemokine 27-like isoform X2 [Mus musculus]
MRRNRSEPGHVAIEEIRGGAGSGGGDLLGLLLLFSSVANVAQGAELLTANSSSVRGGAWRSSTLSMPGRLDLVQVALITVSHAMSRRQDFTSPRPFSRLYSFHLFFCKAPEPWCWGVNTDVPFSSERPVSSAL